MMRLKRLVEEKEAETVDDIFAKLRFWNRFWMDRAEFDFNDVFFSASSASDDDDDEIIIRREPERQETPVSITQCNHRFCRACIIRWLQNGNTACPVCRNDEE
jgi:hypothetical protein